MSEDNGSTAETTSEITPEKVAGWLRDNPDFFIQRDDLLELLRLPDPRGDAVSLLERQAQVLRSRNHELRDRLNALLDVARENDGLFEKTRQLILKLVEARTAEQLFSNLIASLNDDFQCDAVTLIVYDRDLDVSGELRASVRCIAEEDLHEALQVLLRKGNPVCGILRDAEVEQLFGERREQARSAAMVPLAYQGRQGVLAIGSADAQHFRSSMGTLFISHIGDILARRLADLLRHHNKLEARRA